MTVRIILLLIGIPSLVFSQSEPSDIVEQFFVTYEKQGASVALDELYGNNPWMSRSMDAVSNVKSQLEGLTEDFVGEYHGYDLITKKRLTENYVLFSYMVRYDRQPIRFIFQFYRPKDNWVTYSFKFDANIDDELEEAAKVYHVVPSGY